MCKKYPLWHGQYMKKMEQILAVKLKRNTEMFVTESLLHMLEGCLYPSAPSIGLLEEEINVQVIVDEIFLLLYLFMSMGTTEFSRCFIFASSFHFDQDINVVSLTLKVVLRIEIKLRAHCYFQEVLQVPNYIHSARFFLFRHSLEILSVEKQHRVIFNVLKLGCFGLCNTVQCSISSFLLRQTANSCISYVSITFVNLIFCFVVFSSLEEKQLIVKVTDEERNLPSLNTNTNYLRYWY